jgi:hypothetical protein
MTTATHVIGCQLCYFRQTTALTTPRKLIEKNNEDLEKEVLASPG